MGRMNERIFASSLYMDNILIQLFHQSIISKRILECRIVLSPDFPRTDILSVILSFETS